MKKKRIPLGGVKGVWLLPVPIFRDDRGELGVLEASTQLGFEIRRVFFIKVDHANVVRAEHAVSCTQAIIVLSGAVTVDLDDGSERWAVSLDNPAKVLIVEAGVWRRLRDFAPQTIVMMAASLSYADTVNYDVPRPELIPSS
jgi:dTDP-4-dehydrorhamnose 3,5-epimerase-like enzyme